MNLTPIGWLSLAESGIESAIEHGELTKNEKAYFDQVIRKIVRVRMRLINKNKRKRTK